MYLHIIFLKYSCLYKVHINKSQENYIDFVADNIYLIELCSHGQFRLEMRRGKQWIGEIV